MLTESEAKQRWCPFVIVSERCDDATGGFDRTTTFIPTSRRFNNGKITASCRCIASDCMAWRWDKGLFDHQKHDHFYRWVDGNFLDTCDEDLLIPEGDGWTLTDAHKFANGTAFSWKREKTGEDRRGYCGLADRP